MWDQTGAPSAWSATGQWTMGVLNAADWSGARWIGAPDANQPADLKAPKPSYETVLLRREFTVKPNLHRALVQVCGLGQYELTLNGRKVGTDLLTPGWTQYDKTCLYDTYDVTAALHPGPNAAGLFLGNGFFNVHGGRYTKLSSMKRDMDLIRLLLLRQESDEEAAKSIAASYDLRTVAYHDAMVIEAGFVHGIIATDENGLPRGASMLRLTWEGYEFLESIRNETTCNKAKDAVVKTGTG